MTVTREELAERIAELCRQDWPRASLARLGDRLRLDPGLDERTLAAIDEHLRHFIIDQACPSCGSRAVRWTFVYGVAACVGCDWPATVYHYIRDPDEDALCVACDRPRREHVREVEWWGEDGSRSVTAGCPGSDRASDDYRPRDIARIDLTLYAHPYEVRLTKRRK